METQRLVENSVRDHFDHWLSGAPDAAKILLEHVIERAEIDTAHFKGNYPDRVSLEAGTFDSDEQALSGENHWQTLLPESKLKMDQQHYFDDVLQSIGAVSHVRMSIYPDGGVSRIRLFGQVHG